MKEMRNKEISNKLKEIKYKTKTLQINHDPNFCLHIARHPDTPHLKLATFEFF